MKIYTKALLLPVVIATLGIVFGLSVRSQTQGGWQCYMGNGIFGNVCYSDQQTCTEHCAGTTSYPCASTNCVPGTTVTPTPTPTPSPTCYPRPACLDVYPKCLMPEPVEGWCPQPSVSPTPLPGGFQCHGIYTYTPYDTYITSNTSGGVPPPPPSGSGSLYPACYATKEICEKECYSLLMQGSTGAIVYGQSCIPTPCNAYTNVCTQEYAPVCGTDGRTYPNACYAKAAGTIVAYAGECGKTCTTACPPLPSGCQYVKTQSVNDQTYNYDYAYAGVTPYAAPTIVSDPCWCGTVVCVSPTPVPGVSPTPAPVPLPAPAPAPCTNVSKYTSSCWQDGSRVINVTTPTVSQSTISFMVVVKMPTTASVNAIWNRAHYYSNTQKKWMPITMVGTKYPNYQFNAAGDGYVTGTAGASVSVPLADALNGNIYVVTWDYVNQGGTWIPPKSSSCTNTTGCWRLETISTTVQ